MFVSGRLVVSITDKTDVHDISEIFLQVVLYTQNGRDRMVVGFPATCASVPITTNVVSSYPAQAIQGYVIKFVSNLRQVGGFL